VTHLLWAQLMGATLKVATYQRKSHNVTILSRKLQTHVKLIFKYLVVKTDIKTDRNFNTSVYRPLITITITITTITTTTTIIIIIIIIITTITSWL
jgi:hypothetical protein